MSVYCSHCGKENDSATSVCSNCESNIGHVESAETLIEAPKSPQWIVVGIVCALYLVYPSLGIFELIPDAIPIIGSLDEAAATTGLLVSLSRLGLNPFTKK